jgi:hypothetical protein
MKAKCINDQSEEYPNFKGELSSYKLAGLTKDKLYQVEQSKEYKSYYEVINDLGIKENYKKERFEMLECLNQSCEYNVNSKCQVSINGCNVRLTKKEKSAPQPASINLGEQLEKLKKLLATSEDHNKIFSEENERLKKEIKTLENTRDALVKANNELKEENKNLARESKDLEERLDNQSISITNYMKENEELKEKNKTIIVKCIDDENREVFKNKLYKAEEKEEYYFVEDEAFLNKRYWGATGYLKKHFEKIENKKVFQEYIGLKYKDNQSIKEKSKECYNYNCGRNNNNNCSDGCHMRITKDMDYDNKKSEIKTLKENNQTMNKEISQLTDELQQSNFKLKEYETKLPQIKSLVIKLVDINKALAGQIYVEELED